MPTGSPVAALNAPVRCDATATPPKARVTSTNLMRIALGIEYNGTAYHGWQFQERVPTLQQTLERALSQIADTAVTVHCAGRTDRGVHATGQVIHFDTAVERPDHSWMMGGNRYLPDDIGIHWVRRVSEQFDARRSATRRHYRYVIQNRMPRSALWSRCVTWHYRALDADRMHAAAQQLIGEHDFSSFRAAECQATHPRRELLRLDVSRSGEFVYLDVEANAFLHHMVRNLVGVLLPIGEGRAELTWAAEVLKARDRRRAGITAPANGLYLVAVHYPAEFQLPAVPSPPCF